MAIIKLNKFGLEKGIRKLKRKQKRLPRVLGNMAVNHFLDGFRRGGFTDSRFTRWQPRRKRLSRTRTSNTLTERANLVKSGALRRSVRLRSANFKRIKVGTRGIKYANRHNLGLADMPQRQFIGDSRKLEKRVKKKLEKELQKVLRR